MAVTAMQSSSRLQLRFQVGTDDEGRPVYRSRSYSNVKPGASNQDLYDVGMAFSALQEHVLESVRRIDEAELVDMGA